jgi:voltage-gated potassium channel
VGCSQTGDMVDRSPARRSRLAALRADSGYERWVGRTDVPLMALALLFLVLLLVPAIVRDLPPSVQLALTVADVLIWAVFTVDYCVRLYLAPGRWEFVRRHPLDLIVILVPLLRPLRILHGAQALRLLGLVRLVALAGRVGRSARHTLHIRATTYVAVGAFGLVVVAASFMTGAERSSPDANIRSFGDGLWWAMATVSTVGYGDRFPVTVEGRLIATGLMVVGVALLGFLTASVATWFVGQLTTTREEVNEAVGHETRIILRAIDELGERITELERMTRAEPDAPAAGPPAGTSGA